MKLVAYTALALPFLLLLALLVSMLTASGTHKAHNHVRPAATHVTTLPVTVVTPDRALSGELAGRAVGSASAHHEATMRMPYFSFFRGSNTSAAR